jgi:hypothetical protein
MMAIRFGVLLCLTSICLASDPSQEHYAGSQICSTCHKDIAAAQMTTAMANTWHGAVPSNLPPQFDAKKQEGSGAPLLYRLRRVGSRLEYSVRMPDGTSLTLPVEAVIGGKRHGVSFLDRIKQMDGLPLERTALVEARYAYNSPHAGLVLSPGFEKENPQNLEDALGRVLSPSFEQRCLTCMGSRTHSGRVSLAASAAKAVTARQLTM